MLAMLTACRMLSVNAIMQSDWVHSNSTIICSSRNHLQERSLSKTTGVRRAVILAAGRGKRMGSITEDIPKPMLPVNGKPMLEHILERLSQAGISKFLIVIGYRGKIIKNHFRDLPYKVKFREQDPVNGTASAALLARDFIGKKPWLLTYGDILCEPSEYTRCIAVLDRHPATSVVVAVKDVDDP